MKLLNIIVRSHMNSDDEFSQVFEVDLEYQQTVSTLNERLQLLEGETSRHQQILNSTTNENKSILERLRNDNISLKVFLKYGL